MEPSGDDPYLQLAQNVGLLSRAFERVIEPTLRERYGISARQLLGLRLVERGETSPMRIAELAALAPSSASRMLDGLFEMGLLTRTGDPDDRRKTVLGVTERGREVSREARLAVAEALQRSYRHVGADRIGQANRALRELVDLFSRPPAAATDEREEAASGG